MMRQLGTAGILIGFVILVIGVYLLLNFGLVALGSAALGVITMLVGSLCLAMDEMSSRTEILEERLDTIARMMREQSDTSAEEIVDQLRQEGFLSTSSKSIDDEAIQQMLE